MQAKKTEISVTAKQLASLDLLIAKKKAGATFIADDIADVLANVAANATIAAVTAVAVGATPAAVAAAVVGVVADATAVVTRDVGGHFEEILQDKAVRAQFNKIYRRMPIEGLIAVRNMAIVGQKAKAPSKKKK